MKQVAMDGGTPYLPKDILPNILKRLPVKSLIRFQCVCKDWKNLIETPSFIASHLHNSTNQNPLLFQKHDGYHPTRFDLLDCKMQRFEVQDVPMIKWDRDNMVGSCGGLVCFSIGYSDRSPTSFILWNPATRKVKHVPKPLIDFHGSFIIGFGHSPIANDYKIIINYGNEVERVEVYSLSTGLWKEVEFENLEGISFWHYRATTVNGVIFWLGFVKSQDGDKYTPVIVSFDIAAERFAVIPMPTLNPILIPMLAMHENKLVILARSARRNAYYSSIDVWVMNEEIDAKEMCPWTKKYTSNTFRCFLSPMTIWRGEVVCYAHVKYEPTTLLYLLNLTTKKCKKFPVGTHVVAIFNYIESLVSLNNRHIEET